MNFILVHSLQVRAASGLCLPRMRSYFLLLLFLLPLGLHLLDRGEGLDCGRGGIPFGGPSTNDSFPFMRFDPLNGSWFPQINCSETQVVMEVGSRIYRINSIDSKKKSLVMASADPMSPCDPCSCGLYSMITYHGGVETLFSYTEHNLLVLLLYNCSSRVLDFDGVHQLPCSDGRADRYYYTAMDSEFFESKCTLVFPYAAVNQMRIEQQINSAVDSLEGLTAVLQLGFEVTWSLQEGMGCDACVQSGGQCRNYSSLESMLFCRCLDGFTHLHICPPQTGHDVGNGRKIPTKEIIVGGVLATGIFLFAFLLLLYLCCHGKLNIPVLYGKKGSRKDPKLEVLMEKFGHLAPTRYSYSDVEKMTSSFNHKIGQGGYGGVYEGKLDNGCLVAVKVLNGSKGNGKEFFSEVISIGCTYHVHIVSLVGFCLEGATRILIYEFMANGSLEKLIYTEKQTRPSLRWEKLLEIAIGIARGLEYLHHGCNIGILHFDIKPHNILLDEDLNPKISDFGLAKLCRSAESIIAMVDARGTVGYIAPEVFLKRFGGVSSKSDVYSYGMVVLEMVGGRRNVEVQVDNTSEIYFPHWIYKHLNLDGNLKTLRSMTKVEEEIARRMILVGLWCIQTTPTDRPSMSKVLDMLEGRIIDLQIPPMPILSSPSRSVHHPQTNHFDEIVSIVTC